MAAMARRPNRTLITLAVLASMVPLGRDTTPHEDTLNLGQFESAVGLGVDVGQLMTYSDIIMTNDGHQPIVMQRAELLTKDTGAAVEAVRLLDADAVRPGSLIGETLG